MPSGARRRLRDGLLPEPLRTVTRNLDYQRFGSDIAKLEEEYGKLAGDGWFVKGTNARGVVHHELGHAFEKLYNIDAKRIAKEILGAKGDDELAYGLLVNLSEYSSLHVDSEITSEVMAAWLGGTDNWFAEEFMKRILEV